MRTGPVLAYLQRLHDRYAELDEGAVATYIPELAHVDPAAFGICLATVDGAVYEVGDTRQDLTIQSISKPFAYAVALDELGEDAVAQRVGVEPTGDAFNAITLHPTTGMPLNPMVNAGAIATTALVGWHRPDGDRTDHLVATIGAFAGRRLHVDDSVHRSEAATAHRNRAIAHLLRGSGAIDGDPDVALDRYLRQCAVAVDCRDLAVMAATLAAGGRNPLDGTVAASRSAVRRTLAVMATCGMYDGSGEWLVSVGLPAKSGVSGGIIAVLPGAMGIAVWSPPLDRRGNSVRGVRVCRDLTTELDLHLASVGAGGPSPLRSVATLAQVGSRRRRDHHDVDVLARSGGRALVVEVQGDIGFRDAELVVRRLVDASEPPHFAIVDLHHAGALHGSFATLLGGFASTLHDRGGTLVVSGTTADADVVGGVRAAAAGATVLVADDLDLAMEWCEDQLLGGRHDAGGRVELRDHAVVAALDDESLGVLADVLEPRRHRAGELVVRRGDPATEIVFVVEGHLSVVVPTASGDRRLATLAAGSLLGEQAAAAGRVREADVVADTDVECLVLTDRALVALRRDHPGVWTRLLEGIVRVLAERADRTRHELVRILA